MFDMIGHAADHRWNAFQPNADGKDAFHRVPDLLANRISLIQLRQNVFYRSSMIL